MSDDHEGRGPSALEVGLVLADDDHREPAPSAQLLEALGREREAALLLLLGAGVADEDLSGLVVALEDQALPVEALVDAVGLAQLPSGEEEG